LTYNRIVIDEDGEYRLYINGIKTDQVWKFEKDETIEIKKETKK